MADYKIGDDDRRRSTDQLESLRAANENHLVWDTEAPADFGYLYDPDFLLVREGFRTNFLEVVNNEPDIFEGTFDDNPEVVVDGALVRYPVPPRRDGRPLHRVLDELEDPRREPGRRLDERQVSVDHYLHVTTAGKCCPATEPEETGLAEPRPQPAAGRETYENDELSRIGVVVVDTGWDPDVGQHTWWLRGVDGDDEGNGPNLREYAGHGTFIAGVVRCVAPLTKIFVEGFAVGGFGGGALQESAMVLQLQDALTRNPQVINLSAGCRTRGDRELLSFEVFYEERLKPLEGSCVLVAAAGNDSSPAPFWPAAFGWAVGVGSLDRDGRVSSFSNHAVSADVYALGRSIVNAFPEGRYVCNETPNKDDIRVFDGRMMARWSGTSFAAPVVAGRIAAEITAGGGTAADAWERIKTTQLQHRSDPNVGAIWSLQAPYF